MRRSRRNGVGLADGSYELEVVEGRNAELVTPDEPDRVKVPLTRRNTLWGPLEFALYVAPPDSGGRQVAVVGRAGTTILDDITEQGEPQECSVTGLRPRRGRRRPAGGRLRRPSR